MSSPGGSGGGTAGAGDDARETTDAGERPSTTDDDPSRETGRDSGRLALALAVVAVLAVVAELRAPLVAASLVGATVAALVLGRARAPAVAEAVLARSAGVVGVLLAVVAGIATTVAGPSPAWAAAAVALGGWFALLVAAVLATGDRARAGVDAVAWAATATGALLSLALLVGVDDALAALLSGDGALALEAVGESTLGPVLAVPVVLVFGGSAAATVPIVLALAAALAGALLVAVLAVPPHVLLPPRATSVAPVERLTNALLGATVLLAAAALLAFSVGLAPALSGAVVAALRALLVAGIALALLGGAVGALVPRVYGRGDRSLRETLLGGLAGVLAASAATVGFGAGYAPATLPSGALLPVAVACLAAVPVLLGIRTVVELAPWLRSSARLVPAAGLLVAAVGAAVLGAVVAPVVAVVAAVVCWDALAVRHGLLAEVDGADAAAVERVRLAPTAGVAIAGGVVALLIYGIVAPLAPTIRGQPLAVVVVGALALALITLAYARSSGHSPA